MPTAAIWPLTRTTRRSGDESDHVLIDDACTAMSLRLQAAFCLRFGLRREELIEIQPELTPEERETDRAA
jgi:hypothetical protein